MAGTLLNKQPIVVDIELATMLGLNEAIVLQQIHYWLGINQKNGTNFKEGRYWTFNSMKKWHDEAFPFWSVDTVKRIFKNLEDKGLLITGNFNKKGYDRTKWYTIDYQLLHSMCCNDSLGQNALIHCGKMPQSNMAKCTNAIGQNAPTNTRDYTEINTEISQQQGVLLQHEKEVSLLKDFLNRSYTDEYAIKVINLLRENGKGINYLIEKIDIAKSRKLNNKQGYLIEAIRQDYKNNSRNKDNQFNNFNDTLSKYTQEELEEKIRRSQARKYE